MSEKKILKEEQLNKVSGGITKGDCNIVECEICKCQFDPLTVERGPDATGDLENGAYCYATFKCPECREFVRVKVIQVKKDNGGPGGVIYFAL